MSPLRREQLKDQAKRVRSICTIMRVGMPIGVVLALLPLAFGGVIPELTTTTGIVGFLLCLVLIAEVWSRRVPMVAVWMDVSAANLFFAFNRLSQAHYGVAIFCGVVAVAAAVAAVIDRHTPSERECQRLAET